MQKETKNGLPPFRPILSAIGMPTQKCLLPSLTLLIENEYTVIGSFHFAEEICKQDPNFCICSLDKYSLFTNIPRDETIDICNW